jgi:hypothetical protein
MIVRIEKLDILLGKRDPSVCGNAPDWIIESLRERLDSFIKERKHDSPQYVRDFAVGAIRFIADQDVSDCNVILDTLNKMTV